MNIQLIIKHCYFLLIKLIIKMNEYLFLNLYYFLMIIIIYNSFFYLYFKN